MSHLKETCSMYPKDQLSTKQASNHLKNNLKISQISNYKFQVQCRFNVILQDKEVVLPN